MQGIFAFCAWLLDIIRSAITGLIILYSSEEAHIPKFQEYPGHGNEIETPHYADYTHWPYLERKAAEIVTTATSEQVATIVPDEDETAHHPSGRHP